MAKIDKNIIITGLSGSLGDQLIIQAGKGGQTIIRTSPRPSGKPPTEKQQEVRSRFKEAKDYAKEAAKAEPVYAEKAAGTPLSAYNVAIADWFHPPEVEEVDLEGYSGRAGQSLRARVSDDVKVATVRFVIAAEDGMLVEEGAATREGAWWTYQTTAAHPGGTAKVLVVAADLPGHEAQAEEAKTIK